MNAYRTGDLLVEVTRGETVESVHTGHAVVMAPDGRVLRRFGEPARCFLPRSALKPLQAVGLLRVGWLPDSTELALACSSHTGSSLHRELALQMLSGGGLAEADLGCPADLPRGESERRDYLAAGLPASRLAMTCSGKHAAMLRTAQVNGWRIDEYLERAHPLQVHLAETVADLTGDQLGPTQIDGCGAPAFAVSLTGLARAYARIAITPEGPERLVAQAMRSRPDLVEGPDQAATVLMAGIPGLLAKHGAEGVFAAVLPNGASLAVKIDDGAARAATCVSVALLDGLGVRAHALDVLRAVPVLGGAISVGVVRASPALGG